MMDFFLTSLFVSVLIGICQSEKCTGLTLGMCCAGQVWNNVSKTCEHCPPGYYGITCSNICKPPYYGMDCMGKCNCSERETCNPRIGCHEPVNSTTPGGISADPKLNKSLSIDTITENSDWRPKDNKPLKYARPDIKRATEALPVFSPDSSLDTANRSPLEITVTALGVILCLGLIAYVGMAIFEKIVHIRYTMHMRNTERNVHYENVNGAADRIEFY